MIATNGRPCMDSHKMGALRAALHDEKDPRVTCRILAVHNVECLGRTHAETAEALMHCPGWVCDWVNRYREGGIDALRDTHRTGRPRDVPEDEMDMLLLGAAMSPTTPARFGDMVYERTGVEYHPSTIRRRMGAIGLTRKRPTLVSGRKASAQAVRCWQWRLPGRVKRMHDEGYGIMVEDEAIVQREAGTEALLWTPRNTQVNVTSSGSHEKIVVYGMIGECGQVFRTYDGFDSPTTVEYLREAHRVLGKIAVILDRAPQHRSRAVRDLLRDNSGIRLIWLPVGSPEPGAIEWVWRLPRRALLASRHYRTLGDLRAAVSEYLRTTRFGADIFNYLYRQLTGSYANFCA